MQDIAKSESFHAAKRVPYTKVMRIETDGAVVDITVGLTDDQGNLVTRVDISTSDDTRNGDAAGRTWDLVDGASFARIVRRPDPREEPLYRDVEALTAKRRQEAADNYAGLPQWAGTFETWRLMEHVDRNLHHGRLVFERGDRVIVSPEVDERGLTSAYSFRAGSTYLVRASDVREIQQ